MKTCIKQIWSFSAIIMASLMVGCKDDATVGALPEPVDLTMTIANSNLVMGDNLDITFSVTDEKSEISNEDFNIELSLQSSDIEKPAVLFENFPSNVTFSKGEKTKTVSVPVIKEGISSQHFVTLSAFVRSYKLNNPSQTFTVSDYHYITFAIKNSSDNTVREGRTFVLTATIDTPSAEDLTISISPKDGERDRYNNLPEEMIIPAGETSVESEVITMVSDKNTTEDEVLTLILNCASEKYPLATSQFKINRPDAHKGLDSYEVRDERYLYEDPDQMFVSEKNEKAVQTWGQTYYKIMKEGDPHPNSGNVLPEGKWKFYRAYEFHCIPSCITKKTGQMGYTSDRYPTCFADQTTEAIQTAGGCDNSKYGWVTDEGYLRMITLKEKTKVQETSAHGAEKNFGTSAFYANKHKEDNPGASQWAPQNVRIYPGMRIETRARIRGCKNTGMLPGIWLQGNKQVSNDIKWNRWPDFGEIDVMENNSKNLPNNVEMTYHIGSTTPGSGDKYHPTTGGVQNFANKLEDFNIYWMEWIDNSTVTMGINGQETLKLTEQMCIDNGARWPFSDQINTEGLYYILSMMFLHKAEPNATSFQHLTTDIVRADNYNWSNSPVPRMEIDWIRFYIDNTYSDHGKPYNKSIFY
ncbi:MAG: DUF5006 domain-containing protein [Candidatus Phocaeicola faecipullorum]|nr:DUF5006 domain-containing protein [Candidatus Phocaeicola faecipullorum]